MTPRHSRRFFIGMGLSAALSAIGLRNATAQEYATPSDLPLQDVYTFLVLGMDTRPDESELNTDVMMVSRVNLVENTVRTMSIPRDLYVEIPGVGFNKVNQAFKSSASNGRDEWMLGMQATVNTVEHNFGVSIDGTLSIRFEGVREVVDTFGGVTFNNPYYLRDDGFGTHPDGTPKLEYTEGEHLIDGSQALQLMRTRNQDGDDGRVMRQQIIMTALLEEAQKPENISKLPELLEILQDSVITDIPTEVQLQLVASVPSIPTENVHWGTMTHLLSGGILDSGMWVYQGDWSQLPGYMQAFLNGETD